MNKPYTQSQNDQTTTPNFEMLNALRVRALFSYNVCDQLDKPLNSSGVCADCTEQIIINKMAYVETCSAYDPLERSKRRKELMTKLKELKGVQ